MKPISKSWISILKTIIFPENFDTILQETNLHHGSIRDDLMQMLNGGYIQAIEEDCNEKPHFTSIYDSDNLNRYAFQATSKGLKLLIRAQYETSHK